MDEDSGAVQRIAYGHEAGELWHLAPALEDPALLATSYSAGIR